MFCPPVAPDGGRHQGNVVDALVAQPVGQALQGDAQRLQHGVQHIAAGIEELEDEADGNAVDQVGEEDRPLEEIAAPGPEAEHGGEVQRQGKLKQRAAHVVHRQEHGVEVVLLGEDADVVFQPHKGANLGVAAVVEAVLDHLAKGNVGEHHHQQHRHDGEGNDDEPLLNTRQRKPCAEAGLRLISPGRCGLSHTCTLPS